MTTRADKTHRIESIAMLFALIGMLAAVVGPFIVLSTRAGFQGSSIWPIPALVLIDWMLIGILGYFGTYLGVKKPFTNWSKMVWLVVGMLLALLYLLRELLGPFVLISLIFFLASALLINLRKALRWYEYLSALILGAVWNGGLLLVIIWIITPSF